MRAAKKCRSNGKPRVFSLATIAINLPMRVPHLPLRGSTVVVSQIGTEVGGAFNVMSAIERQGVDVINVCPLGTGPNSMFVRRVLADERIESQSVEIVGDVGTKLVFLEEDGHNTSIVSPGVEAEISIDDLAELDIAPGDYVYIYAGDLAFEGYLDTVATWLENLDMCVKVVVAASPLVDALSPQDLSRLLPYVSLLTMNDREHDVLMRKFAVWGSGWSGLHKAGLPTDATILYRLGDRGCIIYSQDHPDGFAVESADADVIDTTGVGDTHTGVVIACLAEGVSIEEAVRRANMAGALVVSKAGSATCPTKEDLDQMLLMVEKAGK